MFQNGTDWNPKQAHLKSIILQEEKIDEAIKLCLEMHQMVHESAMLHSDIETLEDEVWDGINQVQFETMPTIKDVTVAWNIWHITRIEDLTVNYLIAREVQVFNPDWQKKIGIEFQDTGNAMSDDEILALSRSADMSELRNYRNAVGMRTRQVLQGLTFSDMKRKVTKADLQRIFEAGGVTAQKDSIWLLDFWGRKNIAGLLLMPVTRHQVAHLTDCLKLKKKCSRL